MRGNQNDDVKIFAHRPCLREALLMATGEPLAAEFLRVFEFSSDPNCHGPLKRAHLNVDYPPTPECV